MGGGAFLVSSTPTLKVKVHRHSSMLSETKREKVEHITVVEDQNRDPIWLDTKPCISRASDKEQKKN